MLQIYKIFLTYVLFPPSVIIRLRTGRPANLWRYGCGSTSDRAESCRVLPALQPRP